MKRSPLMLSLCSALGSAGLASASPILVDDFSSASSGTLGTRTAVEIGGMTQFQVGGAMFANEVDASVGGSSMSGVGYDFAPGLDLSGPGRELQISGFGFFSRDSIDFALDAEASVTLALTSIAGSVEWTQQLTSELLSDLVFSLSAAPSTGDLALFDFADVESMTIRFAISATTGNSITSLDYIASRIEFAVIPLPTGAGLAGLGLGLVALRRRR